MKNQITMDVSSVPKQNIKSKAISKKWKNELQKYCDEQRLDVGSTTGYCVCGYMEYCDLCEGSDRDLPCVKPILQLAKKKGIQINDTDYNFEKLLEKL